MPAPPTETIQILHMEPIHSSHIIHCDVKPANFLGAPVLIFILVWGVYIENIMILGSV